MWPPLLLGGVVSVVVLLGWSWPLAISPKPIVFWLAIALLILGGALNAWGALTMRRAGTNISPSRPTTILVTSGPFRFSRNPLYVAGAVLLLGLALALNNLWGILALIPLSLVMHYGVILKEERYLDEKFGAPYRQYRLTVRRYF